MQTWTWQSASGPDVNHIVAIAQRHFESEIDQVFVPDPIAYARNVMLAVVTQFYNPGSELVKVAKDNATGAILAYVWAKRNHRSPWSDQEMIMVQMVHLDLELSVRKRLQLVREMIMCWEEWGVQYNIPVVCSTTMRNDQQGFLEIHRRMGYDVRGSYCYKLLRK
jgi:hypothetical protein